MKCVLVIYEACPHCSQKVPIPDRMKRLDKYYEWEVAEDIFIERIGRRLRILCPYCGEWFVSKSEINLNKKSNRRVRAAQKCKECGFLIPIKKRQNNDYFFKNKYNDRWIGCIHSPFYRWEFVDELECPNCGEISPVAAEWRKWRDAKGCLFAFEIEGYPGERTGHYVGVFKNAVKVVEYINIGEFSDERCLVTILIKGDEVRVTLDF
jgi:predicted RNA-binding Zn-ribbon protein involved in translation (DUF1610 family)